MTKDDSQNSRSQMQVKLSGKRNRTRAMETSDQIARDLAADAFSKSEAHEQLCNERWENQAKAMVRIESVMADVKKAMEEKIGKQAAAIIAVLSSAVGFLAARVVH